VQCNNRKQSDSADGSTARRIGKLSASKANDTTQDERRRSPFANLPPELHHCIFEALDSEDVLRLGLTSRYFWVFGRKHIHQRFLSTLGRWAGEELISYAEDEEGAGQRPAVQSATLDADSTMHSCKTLRDFTQECRAVEDIFPRERLLREFQRWGDLEHIPESERAEMARLLAPDYSRFFPADEVWVFRNLTTREYFRTDAFSPPLDFATCGPDPDTVVFGGLGVFSWGGEQGAWRMWEGHQFDITTAARHERDMERVSWKDVSDDWVWEILEGLEYADDEYW
jgi:hypothetical protein